jgi:peptidyl-prolyl cis-trans isomerase C
LLKSNGGVTLKTSRLFTIALVLFGAIAIPAVRPDAAENKSPIIAEYKGGVITVDDINTVLNYLPPAQRAQLISDPQKKASVISQIIEAAFLANEARKIGLDKDPSTKAYIDMNANSILADKYYSDQIKPVGDAAVVPDGELKQYYDTHQDEFKKDKVKARHILVQTEPEANEIYSQLVADPSKFNEIAKEKSLDSSNKDNGGDLGWFERGRMVPEFENTAFSTPKGQISKPVKTRFGWHIIFVDDKTEGVVTPFDEAKESIRSKLLADKKQAAMETKLGSVKTSANLTVHAENFDKVGDQAPGTPAPAGSNAPPSPPKPAPAGK